MTLATPAGGPAAWTSVNILAKSEVDSSTAAYRARDRVPASKLVKIGLAYWALPSSSRPRNSGLPCASIHCKDRPTVVLASL